MHIPDNYLSPATCLVTTALVIPFWASSVKKLQAEFPKERFSLLGVGAAFSFLFMMFNVPLPGGSTGHAVGGTLIAVLLGPWAACVSVSVALLLQALLFGDGGILSFGANCLNMAVVLPFVGYFVYRLISDRIGGLKGELIGAALGSYLALNVAALFAAIEFGIQPVLFRGVDGLPLYCPYPLAVALPAMLIPHLSVAGFVELAFTVAVLSFIRRVSPDFLAKTGTKPQIKPAYALLVALICAVPLGLLASGTAWGEWGVEEIASIAGDGVAVLGFTPQGMRAGFSLPALFPDYSISGLGSVIGYILSAVAGSSILIIAFKLIGAARGGPTRTPSSLS